jgi:hypothetical protein
MQPPVIDLLKNAIFIFLLTIKWIAMRRLINIIHLSLNCLFFITYIFGY